MTNLPRPHWRQLNHGVGGDPNAPFDPVAFAKACEENARRAERYRQHCEEQRAAGVEPCPCCGEYHEVD